MIEIEFEEPSKSKCLCCGKTSTTLTRFVYQDNSAFAVYYAKFTDGHEEKIVNAIIGLGVWGEHGAKELRHGFALNIWQNETNWQISIIDKQDSPWSDLELFGEILNRDAALSHKNIKDVFHITDHIVTEDSEVLNYFLSK